MFKPTAKALFYENALVANKLGPSRLTICPLPIYLEGIAFIPHVEEFYADSRYRRHHY
jgi:hypothetical protein